MVPTRSLPEAVDFLPDTWGRAQVFALSGLDGKTDCRKPFVGQTLSDRLGLLFQVSPDGAGSFRVVFGADLDGELIEGTPDTGEPGVIGPDVFSIRINLPGDSSAEFKLAWLDAQTILGRVRARNAVPCLITSGAAYSKVVLDDEQAAVVAPRSAIQADGSQRVIRFIPGGSGKFAIIRGPGISRIAGKAMEVEFDGIFDRRMAFYRELNLPRTKDGEILKTYVKACAIMKVNVESPCGSITNRWTTPDRWPHRYMWLWDSAFNSLGAIHLDRELGRDCIRAILAKQRSSGFIPHTLAPDPEEDSSMTQPPILAWATWELNTTDPDRNFLADVYPGLREYLAWDMKNMDRLQTGLLQWQFPGFDSGMDNSPRFDKGADFDAVDLNCFAANECQALQQIAGEIGLEDEAEMWKKLREGMAEKINSRLWNGKEGFYLDRRKNGSWVKVKTVDGFLPLFAGIAPVERAKLLRKHLTDPEEFWPSFPVPSVALNEETFELDMWRGPTWINYNWIIISGLRNYGFNGVADELEERTIGEICRWRSERGSIYEFYDPFGKRSPQELKRKGRVRGWPDDGIPVISDFYWSSAIFVRMVIDKYGIGSG